MVDPAAIQQPRGAFRSILDWIDELGQVPLNLLRGDLGAVGRHVANLGAQAVDAALPGDWIPELTKPEDYTTPSDLVGLDRKEHPWLAGGLDFVGDTLTNPLTWVPGEALASGAAKLGGLAAKGVRALPEGEQILQKGGELTGQVGRSVRSVFGAQRLTPAQRVMVDQGAAGKQESAAVMSAIKKGPLATLSPEEDQIVADVMRNEKWDGDRLVGQLHPDAAGMRTDPISLLDVHPGVSEANKSKLTDAVVQAMDLGQQMEKRANVFYKKSAPNPLLFGASTTPQRGFDGVYMPGLWGGQTDEQAINEILGVKPEGMGTPSPIKAQDFTDPGEINQYLQDQPNVTYERSALKSLAKRADAQGTLSQRAEIGKSLTGDEDFAYADPEHRAAANEAIRAMAADPAQAEGAKVLHDLFNGIAPRQGLMKYLAMANPVFKKAAVYGFAIPKIGAAIRNKYSGVWQALSNPESRPTAIEQLKRLPADIGGAIGDAFGFSMPGDALKAKLSALDDAMGSSGGLVENAIGSLRRAGHDDVAEMLQHGVMDGFVRSEDLVGGIMGSPLRKKMMAMADWPALPFRGVEDRMRVGMFLDLRKAGHSASEAARITKDALYDYTTSSAGNRTARDLIPFFQFGAKAIPQQAKFLAEKPYVATALASAMGGPEQNPVYPYMEGKLNIPTGYDTDGALSYITGFGLPFESLSQIPNPSGSPAELGDDVMRDIVGSSQPLVKTALSMTFNKDPYFGTKFGEYDRMPLFGHAGTVGRIYNDLASTGLIQPVASALGNLGNIFDARHSIGERLIDNLTGANLASVDPDQALGQQLGEFLDANPDVGSTQQLYSKSHDPEVQQMIAELRATKEHIKAKRKAAMASG